MTKNYRETWEQRQRKLDEAYRREGKRRKPGRPKTFDHFLWSGPGMTKTAAKHNEQEMKLHVYYQHGIPWHQLKHYDQIKDLPPQEQPPVYLGPTCSLNGHRLPGAGDRAVRTTSRHTCLHCIMGLPPMTDSFKRDED